MAENIVNVKKKHKVHASVYVVSELSRVGKVQHKLVLSEMQWKQTYTLEVVNEASPGPK